MQKNRLIWILISLCLIVLLTVVCFNLINRSNTQLYRALRNHVREHGESTVTLDELTDFDWNKAVFFSYSNPREIYEASGVIFTRTDLTRGVLFIQDGVIVYYEIFPQRPRGFIDLHPIRIFLYYERSVRIFEQDDVFDVGVRAGHFNDRLYWLRPQE